MGKMERSWRWMVLNTTELCTLKLTIKETKRELRPTTPSDGLEEAEKIE
jgi:hypothetical protein